jgi:hypothetical protein
VVVIWVSLYPGNVPSQSFSQVTELPSVGSPIIITLDCLWVSTVWQISFYSCNGVILGFLWLFTISYQQCFCGGFLNDGFSKHVTATLIIFLVLFLKQVLCCGRFEVFMEVTQKLPSSGIWGYAVRGFCYIYIFSLLLLFSETQSVTCGWTWCLYT